MNPVVGTRKQKKHTNVTIAFLTRSELVRRCTTRVFVNVITCMSICHIYDVFFFIFKYVRAKLNGR